MRIVAANEWPGIAAGELPRHIGLIMDGNGRWAEGRGQPRVAGHLASGRATASVIHTCGALSIPWLTFFAFSTENWRRAEAEVAFLVRFREWLWTEAVLAELRFLNAKVQLIGHFRDPRIPRSEFECLVPFQSPHQRSGSPVNVTFALNYGGRRELSDACLVVGANPTGGVSETMLRGALYCPDAPDLDLVVRTGGDQRLSNFMLWQSAYAELIFTETLWPDVSAAHVYSALATYQSRQRRYGGNARAPR